MSIVNLVPDRCVYAVSSSPDINFAGKQMIFTGRYKGANDIYRIFIRFSGLKEKVGGSSQVEKAIFTLHLTRNEIPRLPGTVNLYLYRLKHGFDERRLTWNNQPETFEDPAATVTVTAGTKEDVQLDVTELVQEWLQEDVTELYIELQGNERLDSVLGFLPAGRAGGLRRPKLTVQIQTSREREETSGLYAKRTEYYKTYAAQDFTTETKTLAQTLAGRQYKAAVIHPFSAEAGERARSLLEILADSGYLCFDCKSDEGAFFLREEKENLFVLNDDGCLIPYFRYRYPIVLCDDPFQSAFAACVQPCLLWYDISRKMAAGVEILDRHIQTAQKADIFTYASASLLEAACNRTDALYLDAPEPETLEKAFCRRSLFPYAYICHDETAALLTGAFFDVNGKNFYNGGAERYICDLAAIFKADGGRLLIYQHSKSRWVRRYENADVIGVPDSGEKSYGQQFYELTGLSQQVKIYSAFFEGHPVAAHPCIGISHGVAWDARLSGIQSGEEFWNRSSRYIESARRMDIFVSVDTNTSNWFQTVDYQVSAKMKVIPNYVNTKQFVPRLNNVRMGNKTVILYPRRLYAARGFYLMLEVMDNILEKYPQTEIHFVGKGFEKDTMLVKQKISKWGNRVQWCFYPLDEMSKAYSNADIAVIPTLNSEGTSLSCLEAMASGNAVIATRVGGLTDLIINGYNGLLIDPTVASLKKAMIELLEDKEKMLRLKQNAVKVAAAFSKEGWEQKWKELLHTVNKNKPQTKTETWKLSEIYLENMKSWEQPLTRKLICQLLCERYLIYIRIKRGDVSSCESFGRLQFLGWDEETCGEPDFVVSDESCFLSIRHKPDLILNNLSMQNGRRLFV